MKIDTTRFEFVSKNQAKRKGFQNSVEVKEIMYKIFILFSQNNLFSQINLDDFSYSNSYESHQNSIYSFFSLCIYFWVF